MELCAPFVPPSALPSVRAISCVAAFNIWLFHSLQINQVEK